jgi:hypothetical protein
MLILLPGILLRHGRKINYLAGNFNMDEVMEKLRQSGASK